MENWARSMYYEDTGLPWVMPSPNMPTIDTAVVYPGTVLFEGTNVSEGRGTTRPFELIGAPWVDAEALADTLATYKLPGVHFRPVVFEPTFQKHAKQRVRRLSDSRARSRRVPRGRDRGRGARRDPRAEPGDDSSGGSRRTNTSTRSCRSTFSRARASCGHRSKPACRCEAFLKAGCRRTNASAPLASRSCCIDAA